MTARRTGWQRHFFYRAEAARTTWKLRLGVTVLLLVAVIATRGVWTGWIAWSLVCERDVASSDALLLENFDHDYLLFERAEALQRTKLAARAFVPVEGSRDSGAPNPVWLGIAEVMARQARLGAWEPIAVRLVEPISFNAAWQIRAHLARHGVRSVIVVAPAFRSRRSSLVYRAVLGDAGMQVRCDPVFGATRPERWTQTWHGIAHVAEQFLKLQYYRFYVLPFAFRPAGNAA